MILYLLLVGYKKIKEAGMAQYTVNSEVNLAATENNFDGKFTYLHSIYALSIRISRIIRYAIKSHKNQVLSNQTF